MGRVKRNQTPSTTRVPIKHPSHLQHMLHPTPQPATTDIIPKCKACTHLINIGWSYRCHDPTCHDYSLHFACAHKRNQVNHHTHPNCPLDLNFNNPYPNSDEFSCDICGQTGSTNQWFYHCASDSHEFDTHLDCATTNGPANHDEHHHIGNSTTGTQLENPRPPQIVYGYGPPGSQNVHYGYGPPGSQNVHCGNHGHLNHPYGYQETSYGYQGHLNPNRYRPYSFRQNYGMQRPTQNSYPPIIPAAGTGFVYGVAQ